MKPIDKYLPVAFEAFRFGIVGVIAFGIHYGIYLLLLRLWSGINVSVAYTIGYVISFFCNMWLSSRFTFREGLSVKRGLGFALSHVCNYLLHLGFLNLFLFLGMSEKIAPIPTLCIVVPINFVLVRTVFKSRLFRSAESTSEASGGDSRDN